jgi:phage-related protein
MPEVRVRFYCEADGSAPVLDWLDELQHRDRRAYNKCREAIDRPAMFGYELRRPTADILRDGIYELRAKVGRVNYRLLYFFHGREVVIVAHALTKERAIPPADLERALERKARFEIDPKKHSHGE